MKSIAWDQLLSVEVDEIDDDHRKLLNIFGLLNQSITDGESADYQSAILEELINCAIWHFSHEERLMLKYGYGEIEQHREVHQELGKSASDLQDRIRSENRPILEEDIEILDRWLTEHILTDDMRLGAYLSQLM